jgi:peptidoglycan/LPS O-acetylase OafA/YrhL
MKKPVIAVGAGVILPCLLGYLFGLPFPGRVGRFLAWAGERTYSIYLWQQPFTICDFLPLTLQPVGAAFSIVVGACSFSLFEKPFMSDLRVRQLPVLKPSESVSSEFVPTRLPRNTMKTEDSIVVGPKGKDHVALGR